MLQRLLAASAADIRLTCAYCCSLAPEPQQSLQEIGSDSNVQAEKPVPAVAGERQLGLLVSTFKSALPGAVAGPCADRCGDCCRSTTD